MKKYSKEFKETIVNGYKQGISCKELCSKYSIAKSSLYEWLKQYSVSTNHITKETFTYQEYESLKLQLEKTTRKLEIILQSNCLPTSARRQKQEAIERLANQFPVKEMCRVLNLPTGTYYNYHLRRVNVTQYQKWDEFLKQEIMKIYNESEGRFGAPKIQSKLETRGIKTSLSKVSSLMLQLNIKSKQCRKKSFYPQKNKLVFCKNRLKRNFAQTEPNKYWVSDVTALRVASNVFYLCIVLDLFSRKVIAYRLSSQNNSALVINTFKDAFENRHRPVGLSFHSDQGNPYTSHEFRDLLHSLKVTQSFSNKGNPYDNAVIEDFFSCYKREDYNAKNFEYFDELKESVDAYMQYYNDYRPHETLKNKTPNQTENDYMLGVLSA